MLLFSVDALGVMEDKLKPCGGKSCVLCMVIFLRVDGLLKSLNSKASRVVKCVSKWGLSLH